MIKTQVYKFPWQVPRQRQKVGCHHKVQGEMHRNRSTDDQTIFEHIQRFSLTNNWLKRSKSGLRGNMWLSLLFVSVGSKFKVQTNLVYGILMARVIGDFKGQDHEAKLIHEMHHHNERLATGSRWQKCSLWIVPRRKFVQWNDPKWIPRAKSWFF